MPTFGPPPPASFAHALDRLRAELATLGHTADVASATRAVDAAALVVARYARGEEQAWPTSRALGAAIDAVRALRPSVTPQARASRAARPRPATVAGDDAFARSMARTAERIEGWAETGGAS